MEFGAPLVINILFGVASATIASSKGRSAFGWFFGGFFLNLIGLIIVACLPNLLVQHSEEQKVQREQRRLKEQLRKERMKNQVFRHEADARLDEHDRVLGMNTRGLAASQMPEPERLEMEMEVETASQVLEARQVPDLPPEAAAYEEVEDPTPTEVEWHYEFEGEAFGPVTESEVVDLLESGKLAAANLVWTDSLKDWAKVEDVPEFRDHVTA